MRVLICEDDPILASELEVIADEAGCDVVGVAPTAAAALKQARRTPPGIAIVDLHLGDGRSGPDLAAELASRQVRVIVVSGDTAVDPILARIDHVFLAKPVNATMLRSVLARQTVIDRAASWAAA